AQAVAVPQQEHSGDQIDGHLHGGSSATGAPCRGGGRIARRNQEEQYVADRGDREHDQHHTPYAKEHLRERPAIHSDPTSSSISSTAGACVCTMTHRTRKRSASTTSMVRSPSCTRSPATTSRPRRAAT